MFFALGFANIDNWTARAKSEAAFLVRAHFKIRSDEKFWLSEPDVSLGQIEFSALVRDQEYYIVIGILNNILVEHSALNIFIKPRVAIRDVQIVKR